MDEHYKSPEGPDSKRGSATPAETAMPQGSPLQKESVVRRILRIARHAMVPFVAIIILTLAKVSLEPTSWGSLIEQGTYNFLQIRLESAGYKASLPVTVLDIGDIESETRVVKGQKTEFVPRHVLQGIIQAVADQGPLAIGVDADFSPQEEGLYIDPKNDPDFFSFCLALKEKGVPIYLGVDRMLTEDSEHWLGSEAYAPLAVNIRVPKDGRRMPLWIRVDNADKPIASLALSVAEAYRVVSAESTGMNRRWWNYFAESISTASPSHFASDTFLVDFAPIDAFQVNTIRALSPADVRNQNQRFAGKVVLMGEVLHSRMPDVYVVPGRRVPYAGTLIHASAAYTLINAPLYEPTFKGRLALDLIFALPAFLFIMLLRFVYEWNKENMVAAHRVQAILTFIAVVCILILGVLLVSVTRLMWDDFLVVAVVLATHSAMERILSGRWRKVAGRVWEAIVIEREQEREGQV